MLIKPHTQTPENPEVPLLSYAPLPEPSPEPENLLLPDAQPLREPRLFPDPVTAAEAGGAPHMATLLLPQRPGNALESPPRHPQLPLTGRRIFSA